MLALQALCCCEAVGDAFQDQLNDFLRDAHVHDDLGLDSPIDDEVLHFARDLVQNTWAARAAIDVLIVRRVTDWSIKRLTPIDRNILRLGVHELLHDPKRAIQVVINEAIELAHKFGDKESPAFINGVLDAVRHEPEITRAQEQAGAALDQE